MAETPTVTSGYSVTCHTCAVEVAHGTGEAIDGQPALTEYADSTPGTECPSRVEGCPHKSAALPARELRRPATLADLDDLKGRIDKLEGKARP